MSFQQLLLIIAIFALVGFPIAHFIGKKKRIGFGWVLFFSIFLTPVLALIAALLSPPLKKLPPDNPKDKLPYTLVGIFFLAAAIIGIVQANSSEQGASLIDWYRCIGPGGLALYLFGRSNRNQQVYHNKNAPE